ncbi:MAG: hypothetical protein ACREM3_00625 [Candidatus Rokuibacteriota bacterium]
MPSLRPWRALSVGTWGTQLAMTTPLTKNMVPTATRGFTVTAA